ncbi:beta-propeller domain-containing protein [Virgibacillus ihumii]|uniref:beta-propeller domain-containing protein n=1 Tax=Virgibacillus ihumii TaxID=2686091 RepID=UPI00157C81F7|nr:beta-propeller domain-containing protein [Virgibacillus ihumii]
MINRKTVLYCLAVLVTVGAAIIYLMPSSIGVTIPAKSSYAPSFKDWSIHFSEKMNPNTFTQNTVTVLNQDNEPVNVDLKWNKNHTVLTLQAPESGYRIDHTYMITVSDKVETDNGDEINKTFTHSFTTVAELQTIKNEEQLVTLLKERSNARQKISGEQERGVSLESSQSDSAKNMAKSGPVTSSTNIQENGVNEGDIIKTDGDYIYYSRGTDVVIASAAKKDSKVISAISTNKFRPTELYLHNDLLIMIGNSHQTSRQPSAQSAVVDRAILPPSRTTAMIYNVSDPEQPEKVREVSMDGSLITTRKMNGHLYLIANHHPPIRILKEKKNGTENLRPSVKDSAVSNKAHPLSYESMYFFPDTKDENFLLLGSINLNKLDEKAKIKGYLGASSHVYMSKKHLYIATYQYSKDISSKDGNHPELSIARPPINTKISQFKIRKGTISYNASTVVQGSLINQFAMDEHDGTFRVATTKGTMWNDDKPSTNNLFTFDMQMNPLGSLEGLAKGERIYSVRFMDDTAYMVTFKQVDPLFVIDLKNPKKPTVLGKLKIPGFSNYLHPLDEDHVIGFGQNTRLVKSERGKEPRVQIDGLKISVFDVSNPAKPKEEYSEIIGEGHSYTELNHNHHALYKHPTRPIFGFPATIYDAKTIQKGDATYQDESLAFQGIFLYKITPDDGIQLKDTFTNQENNNSDYPSKMKYAIKRMVSVDNTLYSFSQNKMSIYDLQKEKIIQHVPFPDMKY